MGPIMEYLIPQQLQFPGEEYFENSSYGSYNLIFNTI